MSIKMTVETGIQSTKAVTQDIIARWNNPAKGNLVSNKEIANYSIAGMGNDLLMMFAGYCGGTFLGMVLGLRPMHVQTINTIIILMRPLLDLLRATIMDNTNTRWGKYKPFILLMGTPFFIVSTIFVFMPFEIMTYVQKLIVVGIYSFTISLIRPYLECAYDILGRVLTPNTKERSKIFAVKAIVFSIAPTIYGFFIPVFAGLFPGTYTNINLYRWVIAPFSFLGIFLSLFAVFGCQERVIEPKRYRQKSNVFRNVLEVYKNKYWWIRQIASWIGFLEGACAVLFLWMYIYGNQDMVRYALLRAICGESATIAMIITPFLLAKMGDRKLLMMHNGLNIIFVTLMLFSFKNPILFFILIFCNEMVNYLTLVYNPVIDAETADYQQYISGKRVDNAFSVAGCIGLPVVLASGYVIPYIYEFYGITTNFDILYDPYVRNNVFTILCILSIIGATLNLVPFFFFDMSRSKHEYIIKILKLRAIFEDKISDSVTPNQIVEVVENHREYEFVLYAPMPDLKKLKNEIKAAKRIRHKTGEGSNFRKVEIKQAKKDYKDAIKLIEDKKVMNLYTKELKKYEGHIMEEKLILARSLIKFSPEELLNKSILDFNLHTLPINNENTKLIKCQKKFTKHTSQFIALLKKNYPNQKITCPSQEEIDQAHAMPCETKKEKQLRMQTIKKLIHERNIYEKTLYFYNQQLRFIKLSEVSDSLNYFMENYDEAVRAVDEQHILAQITAKAKRGDQGEK